MISHYKLRQLVRQSDICGVLFSIKLINQMKFFMLSRYKINPKADGTFIALTLTG
jgi:hypothetical protein